MQKQIENTYIKNKTSMVLFDNISDIFSVKSISAKNPVKNGYF